jgi:hypothetical protein
MPDLERSPSVHARITTMTIQPNMVSETTRIYNERIMPVLKAAGGNKGVLLVIDQATGKGESITLWNTEADGRAYDASGAYREQVAKLTPFFSAPPSLATYEVAAQG